MEKGFNYDDNSGISLTTLGGTPLNIASSSIVSIGLTGNNTLQLYNFGNNNAFISYGVTNSYYWSEGLSVNGGLNDWILYDNVNYLTRVRLSNQGLLSITGTISSNGFILSGGLSTQFLKANGTIDSSIYLTASSLTPYALDNNVVHLTGTESISGYKSFNSIGIGTMSVTTIGVGIFPGVIPSGLSVATGSNIKIYNTINSTASNYEGVSMGWASNQFTIAPINAGTGIARTIVFGGGTGNFSVTGGNLSAAGNLTITGAISNVTSTSRFSGAVGIGTVATASYALYVSGTTKATQFAISALNTAPISSTASGVLGDIIIDGNYIYFCKATNTWVRSALTTF